MYFCKAGANIFHSKNLVDGFTQRHYIPPLCGDASCFLYPSRETLKITSVGRKREKPIVRFSSHATGLPI